MAPHLTLQLGVRSPVGPGPTLRGCPCPLPPAQASAVWGLWFSNSFFLPSFALHVPAAPPSFCLFYFCGFFETVSSRLNLELLLLPPEY